MKMTRRSPDERLRPAADCLSRIRGLGPDLLPKPRGKHGLQVCTETIFKCRAGSGLRARWRRVSDANRNRLSGRRRLPYIGVVFYFRTKRSHPFSSRSTGYLTPLITFSIELWPAASARTTVAPLIGNGYCRWMTEGPMNNAIPFRESHQFSQLIGVGVGIQVKPQPNGF